MMLSVFGVRHASLFTERPFWHGASLPSSVLDCHTTSPLRDQGPTVRQWLSLPRSLDVSQALEPWALRELVILFILDYSGHLAVICVLPWEPGRGVSKIGSNLPVETEACSRLLVFSDILRRLQQKQ